MEVDLSLLVAESDGVIVVDRDRLESHHVVAQSLLELGRHEIIAWSRLAENRKVDLEPEKVEEEWDDDQANSASSKVLSKFNQGQRSLTAVDVHKIPQINQDRDTDGEEGEYTDVFDGDDTAQTDACQKEPLPPFPTKGLVSLLVEADVAEHRERHEEDERGIEEDQASLTNVGVIEEHEAGCGDAGRERVARLPHDQEDDWDGEGTKRGGHSTVCDIWDLVGNVRIADVLEEKLALVSNKPSSKCEEELSKRRVDVEEVGSLQVV